MHAREGTYATTPEGCRARLDADVVDHATVTLGDGWHVREGDAQSGWYRWATHEAALSIERAGAGGFDVDAALELELEPNPYEPELSCEVEVVERGAPVARVRISSAAAKTTRFSIALEDRVPRHDLVLRVRDGAPTGDGLPLFERRAGLAYRLRSARLRRLPLKAATAHQYPTLGPLQAHETGLYHFAAGPARGPLSFSVFDTPDGEPIPATVIDVHAGGEHYGLVSAELRSGDLLWLSASSAGIPVHGSASPGQMQPTPGLATVLAWTRVLVKRLSRMFQQKQRQLRASMVPTLRAWVQRFDPAAQAPHVPSADDRSGTTEELAAVRDFSEPTGRVRFTRMPAAIFS